MHCPEFSIGKAKVHSCRLEKRTAYSGSKHNTHRHLTENTGLDLEVAIEEHYHKALEVINGVLKRTFSGFHECFHDELQVVKRNFTQEALVWLNETRGYRLKRECRCL